MKYIIIAAIISLFSSCSFNKISNAPNTYVRLIDHDFVSTKKFNRVILSYTYSRGEKPQVNWDLAIEDAYYICNAYGYRNVSYVGYDNLCIAEDVNSCKKYQIRGFYDCY